MQLPESRATADVPAARLTDRRARLYVRSPLARYATGVLLASLATALTYVLRVHLAPDAFLIFYPAVVATAFLAGSSAGLIVTAAGALAVVILFHRPSGSLVIPEPVDALTLAIFVGLGVLISVLISRMRRAQRSTERRAAEAAALAAELSEKSGLLDGHAAQLEERTHELERALAAGEAARREAERAYGASERERRRLVILAETSRALAERIGYEERLHALAQVMIREVADYCFIDLLTEAGELQRFATAARDPTKRELVDPARMAASATTRAAGMGQVLATGEPLAMLQVSPAAAAAYGIAPAEIQAVSLLVMPLIAGHRRLGLLTVIRAEASEPFVAADVEQVQVMAGRAALMIELARLYDEAQAELARRQRAEESLREKSSHLEALSTEQQRMLAELEVRTSRAEVAERAARAADSAKSQFLAVMSHELRTPLNAIMGYTDLLQAGVGGPPGEQQSVFLDRIRVSVLHLRGLIDQVLSLARIEAGRDQVELERTDLGQILREVAAMVQAHAEGKGLRLEVTAVSDVVASTDPGKLRQILINLANNAVKFTDEGEVRLALRVSRGLAEVEVSDTGIGIPPEYHHLVFDPFTQVDQSRTRRAGGSGLGLSVSRKLALLLGGELRFESAPGRGSRFILTLPLAEVREPAVIAC